VYLSILYVGVQRVLQLVLLRFRPSAPKDLEIVSSATSWRYCAARSGSPRFGPLTEYSYRPQAD
jgi:hypothetical protein